MKAGVVDHFILVGGMSRVLGTTFVLSSSLNFSLAMSSLLEILYFFVMMDFAISFAVL